MPRKKIHRTRRLEKNCNGCVRCEARPGELLIGMTDLSTLLARILFSPLHCLEIRKALRISAIF